MRLRHVAYAGLLAVAAGLAPAGPATAAPGDDPCGFAFNLLCRFVPIAPDLDHDIDLTVPAAQGNPPAPPPLPLAGSTDSGPPAPTALPDMAERAQP